MGKQIIGIDIGGTKITGIVFNGSVVLDELTIITPKTFFEFERNLFKLVDFLSAKNKIAGIGIGIAGLANPKTGIIRVTHNAKFKASLNLVKLFKNKYGLPVKIDNDAACFTRAEMFVGQGRGLNNFLGITLGTGIGGGIVINKKIYRGSDNSGGEFGQMALDKGLLETRYFQPARQSNNYKALGQILGRTFATLINFFAPDAIILGGGLTKNAGNKFLGSAKKEMKKFLYNEKAVPVILTSKLKNAGAIGAALLFKK